MKRRGYMGYNTLGGKTPNSLIGLGKGGAGWGEEEKKKCPGWFQVPGSAG